MMEHTIRTLALHASRNMCVATVPTCHVNIAYCSLHSMSGQNRSDQISRLKTPMSNGDTRPHVDAQIPDSDMDIEEQMKWAFEQFGQFTQDLLLNSVKLNNRFERPDG